MLITVVTLSFNQGGFLRECIDSVLCQSGAEVEYVIVDPGSSDGSRDVILSYGRRIHRCIFERDHGPGDGLNKGFAGARGEVLYYLNADDRVLPGAFATVAQYCKRRPECGVVYGNGYLVDENGRRRQKLLSGSWNVYRFALGACVIVQQATFFRRTAFNRTSGFNPLNRTCWDGELLLDLGLAGVPFVRAKEYLGEFRVYPDSISGSGRLNEQYHADRERLRAKVFRERVPMHVTASAWTHRAWSKALRERENCRRGTEV